MSKHRTHGTIRNRLLSGVLCLALVLGLLPAGLVFPAEAAGWADPYGQQLVEWGIMRGDISGNLNLNSTITRAEFVTMINRAYGYKKMGAMPFTDVPSKEWYAQDINIAYNANYFKGTSATTAAPLTPLTREEAAVLVARNLMLQETVGETLGFTDSRSLAEWSRGLIGSVVKENIITGYPDGGFHPANNITRGEVAAMLVRAIGNPVNYAGSYNLGDVYGNVTISSSNVTLRNTTIVGNLYISGGVDLGNVLLENVTVLGGRIVISGGGESDAAQASVVLRNVEAGELVVDSMIDQFVTIRAQGVTDIAETSVRSSAYLDDSSWPGYGLSRIELDGGGLLQLSGSIKEVVNLTPGSDLQLVQGSAQKITIDEYAADSKVLVDTNTRMDELNLDVATTVTGNGDIKSLNVGVSGSTIGEDILPDKVTIRPGSTTIIAAIDKEKPLGNVSAAELSSEPMLAAGYPTVTNLTPTTGEVLISGNKLGAIYWAISAVSNGSVSAEDLISNPSYGSNIFEAQAGWREVAAKTVYSEKIEKLTPGGSYYISAILVDGRGKRSAMKVYSFTAPDDTTPAFNTTPELTKQTTEVVQVTATANKNCLLYWALLPAGAKAPTAQEFRSEAYGGDYGHGNISVVKNVPTSITTNTRKLMEKTDYVLYLWLTDHNGAKSMPAPIALPVRTPDETAPVVTAPYQTDYGESTADITFSINEAPATLYWAVVADGNETFIAPGADDDETEIIMSDLRTKIKVESGTGAFAHGAQQVADGNAYKDIVAKITGLDTAVSETNNYTLYYIGKDAAGNYSDKVRAISIQTLDTIPPSVGDPPTFTKYNGDKLNEPMADSGVKLVFSEQIKGSAKEGAPTFLELYSAAQDRNLSAEERSAARDVMATELAAHIQLYSVPRTGDPVLMEPLKTGETRDDWVIDFHNAVVRMENGKLVVFLPGESDAEATAIRMDSGVTYYFQLLGIYDNAFIPNGLSNSGSKNPSGNVRLQNFTTVYAQVTMIRNGDVDVIDDNCGKDYAGNSLKGTRLDMCFDLIPKSTKKVPYTERWDLIMWSDTSVAVKLYRQEVYSNGTKSAWELVNKTDAPVRMDVTTGSSHPAIGMGYAVQGNVNNVANPEGSSYAPVQTTLKDDGVMYRYGVHFTRVGLTEEEDATKEPDSWSELVTMEFSLVAGSRSDVYNVSNLPGTNYKSYVDQGLVTEIGNYTTTTGTTKIMTIPKQFTDTKVPEFQPDSPKLTAGSGTIHMELSLGRPGKIYYVVAPQGTVNTGLADGTWISSDTVDGQAIDDEIAKDASLTTEDQKKNAKIVKLDTLTKNKTSLTYIPTGGMDRVTYKDYIAYTTVKNSGGTVTKEAEKYLMPTYGMITDPKNNFGSNVISGTVDIQGGMETVDITGLMPEQVYYVYFVRQGGGMPDEIVEVYRVKTTKVNVPIVTVTGTSTTATMTPNEECQLSFALVEYNNLPSFITEETQGTGTAKVSILTQMQTRSGGTTGKSEFDENTIETLKKQVAEYVLGTGQYAGTTTSAVRWSLPDANYPDYKDPIAKAVTWDFTEEMEKGSTVSEYVVLVVARHIYGGTGGNDYGYGAVQGLFTRDKVAPEFQGTDAANKYLVASVKANKKVETEDDQAWKQDPGSYTYSGSVSVTFSKDIYFLQDGVRYPICYDETPGAGKKSLMSILGGNAVSNGHAKVRENKTGGIGSSFDLVLENIAPFEEIIIFAGGYVCNRSNEQMKYRIKLSFDPHLTTKDYFPNSTYLPSAQPGFTVTMT